MHKHELCVLDHSGHRSLTWDDATSEGAAIAKSTLDDLRAQGYAAYSLDAKGDGKVIWEFDPEAERIVVTPPLVGG